ncbi:uncharacterized protein TNCV_1624841 [Trichonephila clavipes]|nr:uncharacterized protein TNCV_1624841 [Trichonephila clavipes]
MREVLQRLDDYGLTINACKCMFGCSEVPLIAHPSQDADLALMTDANDFGLGASLNEITSDDFKPLGIFSKKLTPAKTKYSAFDHELMAAYSAIKYIPGIDNVPADAFSWISAIVTPSTIDYEEFAQMQRGDVELKALSVTNQTLPGSTTEIYYVAAGSVAFLCKYLYSK